LSFLVDDNAMEEHLIRIGNKDIVNQEDVVLRAYLLAPAIQTNFLINECVSLEMSMTGGGQHIKLSEPSGSRKDRYSSASYGNYYISLLDQDLLRVGETGDTLDVWSGAFGFV
jgi:chemotaxis receptor (MCP) glutamine deamidase CheD